MTRHLGTDVVRPAERGPQSTVCAGISALVRERWGRGPSRTRAEWAGADALVVILEDAHTAAERTLLAHGHPGEVLAGRRLLAEIEEPALRRIVESATGRTIRSVLSQSALDPPVSAHVFLFATARGGRQDDVPLGDALREALEQTSAARAVLAQSAQAGRQNAARMADSRAALDARRGDPSPGS